MKRILEILQKLSEGDKKGIVELFRTLFTGTPDEKQAAILLMKVHRDVAQAAVIGFVKRFLALNPKRAAAFIDVCEMMGVPEEDCETLLKLKGITFDENKEEEKNDDDEDMLNELKNFLEKFNED